MAKGYGVDEVITALKGGAEMKIFEDHTATLEPQGAPILYPVACIVRRNTRVVEADEHRQTCRHKVGVVYMWKK